MKTNFTLKFSKDADKLRDTAVKTSVITVIEQVEAATKPTDIINLKKLKGHRTAYRIRLGDYRIGVFILHDTVEFARIVHRKDIYNVFP